MTVPGCCESGNQLAVMVCLDFFREKGIGRNGRRSGADSVPLEVEQEVKPPY